MRSRYLSAAPAGIACAGEGPSRGGKMSEPTRLGGYPENHVLAILPDDEQARAAMRALVRRGIPDERVHAVEPPDGGKPPPGNEGVLAAFNVTEDALIDYAEALQEGKSVLAIEISDDTERTPIREAMLDSGASAVRFFGRYIVESLDHARA